MPDTVGRERLLTESTATSSSPLAEGPLDQIGGLPQKAPRLSLVPTGRGHARKKLSPRVPPEPSLNVAYGGPDRPKGRLRNLLEQRVDAVGPGGAIYWMTYYFRDEKLADALIRAHRRGVAVRICLEGRPRNRAVNQEVIRLLAHPTDGIGRGLRVVQHALPLHLHTKIYCFSDPQPSVLVGSFNPSGNEPEDPAIIADIGDQDRGHNLLVEAVDPEIVAALRARVAAMHDGSHAFRPVPPREAVVRAGRMDMVFFPLVGSNPLIERLSALESGSMLRIAASHVRDSAVAQTLAALVRRGVAVQLLTGGTRRRTPGRIIRKLIVSGVDVFRFMHFEELPMHAKFMLAQSPSGSWAAFGSYNLTKTSRWLNHELLAFSSDPHLWQRFDQRWAEILADPFTIDAKGLASVNLFKLYKSAMASCSG